MYRIPILKITFLIISLSILNSCAVPNLYFFNTSPYGTNLNQKIQETLVVKIDERIKSITTVDQGGTKPLMVLQYRETIFENIKGAFSGQFERIVFYDEDSIDSNYELNLKRFEAAFVQGEDQRDKNFLYDLSTPTFKVKIRYEMRFANPKSEPKIFNGEVISDDRATSVDHVHRVFKNAVKLTIEDMNNQLIPQLKLIK